ncbi:unnamed protein product [Owenia fusiformis]|uniref:Uncharacterized protein n=1 Tax=Owenia fusiformis TaxID=6347 RepID=A0A8S4PVC1_OWEFU|nr:unnamed protein product [Owenia fusiformis]
MSQLNDATENGNFTRLNDNIQLDFGEDEVKTTFKMEKYVISGTGRSTVYTTMVRQKKLGGVDGLAFTIQSLDQHLLHGRKEWEMQASRKRILLNKNQIPIFNKFWNTLT